ncbi:hypothetical protein PVAP13_7NG420001 [Panicum virgatum]|uniref:Secreted protein n=1 Tax=Panicum virgatum TaxID=38727 RepID=A0A8T0Q7Q8_PANVG|nr:hypothetical protein PVAP13_7NG420001 [Panicum virgatum]
MCVTPPGIKCGITPLIRFASLALLMICERASAARLKRRGDRGSPCLSPLCVLKYGPLVPLMVTQTLPPLTVLMIQPLNLSSNPFLCITSSTKSQEILS